MLNVELHSILVREKLTKNLHKKDFFPLHFRVTQNPFFSSALFPATWVFFFPLRSLSLSVLLLQNNLERFPAAWHNTYRRRGTTWILLWAEKKMARRVRVIVFVSRWMPIVVHEVQWTPMGKSVLLLKTWRSATDMAMTSHR